MNSEDVIVYLTSLVAIGIIVVGLLATLLHSTTLAPIVIIGIGDYRNCPGNIRIDGSRQFFTQDRKY